MAPERVPLLTALGRGLRCRCPRCGKGALYQRLYQELERCPACGVEFDWYSGEVLGFLYLSTAFVTGLFVIAMLLWRPATLWMGRLTIVPLALVAYVVTSPFRKGTALALKMTLERATS